jgi:DNA repair photolyase
VCDPYQPLEAQYKLTRQCLEILVQHNWPVTIQTRSPLVIRDIDMLQKSPELEVGFSVTTADDSVRALFEPQAPPIDARLAALDQLHHAGIRTYAMIAPILPGAEGLGELLKGKVDCLLIDRMNYHYADWVYRQHGLEDKLTSDFFQQTSREIADLCEKSGIVCNLIG